MKSLGILYDDDLFLYEDKEDMVIRRNEVFNGTGRTLDHGSHKIIAYFGDAMGEFQTTHIIIGLEINLFFQIQCMVNGKIYTSFFIFFYIIYILW